jgi:glycosyltransferase involved in cell wall biosynthesis
MKILFVYKHKRSFIKNDLEMLKKHHDVIPFLFKFSKILQLRKQIKKCDVVFIWFASFHSYITAKLTNKPIIIVTGGYDVAGEQSIDYGLMLNPIYKHIVKYVLNKANNILAVSQFNKKEIEKHLGIKKSQVIYNCIDYNKFIPKGKKENIILTVGFIKKETWIRKGIKNFVRTAQLFNLEDIPGKFVVIGKISGEMKSEIKRIKEDTPNIIFTGFISDEKILKWYQRAKVYCQFSEYESFGIAPAEAMLCECTPVVTEKGALNEVVGDAGFYANLSDLTNSRNAILRALKSNKGNKARSRIKKLFSPENREAKLMEVLNCLGE